MNESDPSGRAILMGPVMEESLASLKKRIRLLEPDEDDLLIAVDGGLDIWRKVGIRPDIAVGDWDSIKDKKLLKRVEHLTLPQKKDWNDLYFGLNIAAQSGASEIVMMGLTGGRVDHQLSVLMEVSQFAGFPGRAPGPIAAYGPEAAYFWITPGEPTELAIPRGKVLSIFSMVGNARGVSLSGFKYSGDFDVFAASSLGLGNSAAKSSQHITVEEGVLLLVVPKI
jgi:thiamine pyrophosphokinase